MGQRIQTTQAGVTRTFFYDINGSVLAEYEATGGAGYGALKRLNVYGAGRLLAVDEVQPGGAKVTSYRMGDRQGSTRVLMDAAGAVTSRHDYLPFGEELGAGTGAPGSPTGMRTAAQGYSVGDNVRQRYADTRLDDATGLDHTLWRKLETRAGRWTTPDPYGKSLSLTNPQSFNRYAYVNNDPVNFVDPNGLIDVIKIYTWAPNPFSALLSLFFGRLEIDAALEMPVDSPTLVETGSLIDQDPVPRPGPDPTDRSRELTQDQRKNVDPRVNAAIQRMKDRPGCAAYIKGDSSYDPAKVLTDLNRTNGIRFLDTDRDHAQTIRPGGGSGATILLHQQYFNDDVGGLTTEGDRGTLSGNPSTEQAREMVLLHELRHATTGIGHDTPGETNEKFYDRVFNFCIR